MSEAEESPAQRQARIRREKREAKIKAGGSERLDKITKLSGRTPEMSKSTTAIKQPVSDQIYSAKQQFSIAFPFSFAFSCPSSS
jgi:GET complex subunit GET2